LINGSHRGGIRAAENGYGDSGNCASCWLQCDYGSENPTANDAAERMRQESARCLEYGQKNPRFWPGIKVFTQAGEIIDLALVAYVKQVQ
jgi:hypothetical protein